MEESHAVSRACHSCIVERDWRTFDIAAAVGLWFWFCVLDQNWARNQSLAQDLHTMVQQGSKCKRGREGTCAGLVAAAFTCYEAHLDEPKEGTCLANLRLGEEHQPTPVIAILLLFMALARIIADDRGTAALVISHLGVGSLAGFAAAPHHRCQLMQTFAAALECVPALLIFEHHVRVETVAVACQKTDQVQVGSSIRREIRQQFCKGKPQASVRESVSHGAKWRAAFQAVTHAC